MNRVHSTALILLSAVFWAAGGTAQQPVIPHAQERPPNEPRDPDAAAALMTVPAGFAVEVVASEPDLINPVAMAIDERGRFWVTESVEYPRDSAGPGRDRVKILEDTTGDGRVDTITVFLEKLNIPSGVQVGHGGVWIANAPDLLFVPDADRDGVPDGPPEVVVTGFGRTDTHELPNSLTWGPDGWLYGLNGVFNHCHVRYPRENPNYAAAGGESQPGWQFTCAMFRVHPRTREFQVFCEGTSNPWGIAFDEEGEAFVSACVIDHLWHLVETGSYHRQGGPYPPHTWKIGSIVGHKHQKAAYCGITWFDSDAYPEQYRRKLYMGNVHGGCINVDRIERQGSTYAGFGEPDFLTANDAWFMPVVQKTGPDGCLYILDWYDRYHCYQDARRDPEGIDRSRGRLYRVRYGQTPRQTGFDLAGESDAGLIALLDHPNVWRRETAARLLQERLWAHGTQARGLHDTVTAMVSREDLPIDVRRRAFRVAAGGPAYDEPQCRQALLSGDPQIRAWAIRTVRAAIFSGPAADREARQAAVQSVVAGGLEDSDPAVRLQSWIFLARSASQGLAPPGCHELIKRAAARLGSDGHAQRIAWQAIKSYYGANGESLADLLTCSDYRAAPLADSLAPHMVDWIVSRLDPAPSLLMAVVRSGEADGMARQVFRSLASQVQNRQLAGDRLEAIRGVLAAEIEPLLARPDHPSHAEAVVLSASWADPAGCAAARQTLESSGFEDERRLAAAEALIAAGRPEVLDSIAGVLAQEPRPTLEFRGRLLAALSKLDGPAVAEFVLAVYPRLEADLQPRAVELLTQRPDWAGQLLSAIGAGALPAGVLSVNQARKIAGSKDAKVRELLGRHWGTVREGRSPDREQVIAAMQRLILAMPGDPHRGHDVFRKSCAQCHRIYGAGAEVGPDITLNGRNDFRQLLSNVFDPNLVIGSGYQSCTVVTADGRVLNGLLVEDSPQRVVLTMQGGKREVITRDEVEVCKVNQVSLMPEGIENQLMPQEIADLFAFLTLDKPPADPTARRLPGVPQPHP